MEGHFLIETQIMLSRLYENLQRKKQIQILKKNCSHLGNIRIGIANHFTIYPQVKSLNLGKDINFRNYIHLIVQNNAELIIGNRVFLNNFCSINCLEKIEIGDNTLFGENVKIYDHNHDYQTQPEFEVFHSKFKTAAVKIGKNCWLGSNFSFISCDWLLNRRIKNFSSWSSSKRSYLVASWVFLRSYFF